MSPARLAVPWYLHPAEGPREWEWLAAQRNNLSFAVVNVHNGPGQDGDEYYPAALAGLHGIRMLGYVPVDYGHRPFRDVAADVAAWQKLYHVDGIMFDELPASARSLDRCARYAALAREAGVSFLAANPGTFPSPGHLHLFDVTAVFEGTAKAYARFGHPDWAVDVPPSRLWHLVYDCGPEQIGAIEDGAGARGAGHVYATDRSLPNPWLGPPTGVSRGLLAETAASGR